MRAPSRWRAAALALALAAFGTPGSTEGDRAGDFDHYILALSWSPSWCAAEPERADADQCRRGMGFLVHGLWPQRGDGWPAYCRTARRDPTRAETAAMADIMGSAGLAWHAWRKHGRCADLDPAEYFAATRRAASQVDSPLLEKLAAHDRIDPQAIEDAFMRLNPGLRDAMMSTRCADGRFTEIRLCLDLSLSPKSCNRRNSRDCAAGAVDLPPAR